ncbi:MAG: hypothetical protein R2845_04075 [Thermomicrobiales bacterium]
MSATLAALAVCGPVALFAFICWALLIRGQCSATLNVAMSLAPLAIILLAFVPGSIYWVALVMIGIAVAINLEPGEAPEVAIACAGLSAPRRDNRALTISAVTPLHHSFTRC